jgi:hypothetical protein
LRIDFLEFEIASSSEKFIFILHDLDSRDFFEIEIPYSLQKPNVNISQPPRKLLNHISTLNEETQKSILDIRNQILGFDKRIKEIIAGSHIFYGKTEKSPCAEFFISPTFKSIRLFLWLPHPDRKKTCRMEIETKNFISVDRICYSSKGTKHNERVEIPIYGAIYPYWSNPTALATFLENNENNHWDYATRNYAKLLGKPDLSNSLNLIVEIALDKWLERISTKPSKLVEVVPTFA